MQTNNLRGFILKLKEKLDYYGLAQLKKTFDITDEELTEMCKLDKGFKKLITAKGFIPLEDKNEEPKQEEVQEPVKKVKTTSKKKASK